MEYNNPVGTERWLSWSKAHDWKSCVRLITDRGFESLSLRQNKKGSPMGDPFLLWRKDWRMIVPSEILTQSIMFMRLLSSIM